MDFIISLIACTLVFFMGVSFGWNLRERMAERVVKKFLKEMEGDQEVKESFINISIEKHNNTYYVYDKDDNSFMGQASNRIELEKVLGERFPGKRFMADSDNLKEVGFK
jgi:hypothetical protein